MTVEYNIWYRLIGNPRIRLNIVNHLLFKEGYVCVRKDFTIKDAPELIKLTREPKRLSFRTKYREEFVQEPIMELDAEELLHNLVTIWAQDYYDCPCEPNQPMEVNKVNRILELSFQNELRELEENYMNEIHNINMDNPYLKAISSALNTCNKITGCKYTVENCGFKPEMFWGEKECKARELLIEKKNKAEEALRNKYQTAETLLNMADTYAEKQTILVQYTKGVMNKIVDLTLKK